MLRISVRLLYTWALIAVCLLFAAGWKSCDIGPKPLPTVDSKLLEIGEHKNLAIDKVKKIREVHKDDPRTLAAAEQSYSEVRAKYNSWIDLLANHTLSGTDVPESADYKSFTASVGQKWAEFEKYSEAPPTGPAPRGGVEAIVGEIVKDLADAGINWWKAKKQLEAEARKAAADDLRAHYPWPTWSEIH